MPLKLLLLLCLPLHLWAQTTHMAILGGGGEPEGDKTIFDFEMSNLGNYIKKTPKTDVVLSFNGGHKRTEEILNNGIAKPNQKFTNEAFESIITEYEMQILSGHIKAGDQLMVYISTHGAQKTYNEKTHQIATSGTLTNLATLQGSKTVSLDRLENLAKIAKDKGIKLAILDFSCHSGNALPLANSSTCVITSTGPDHFAWAGNNLTFNARFADRMAPGKNLEEVFLEAFGNRYDTAFPMISTPQGLELNQKLYSKLTPFLFQWEEKDHENKLSPFLEKQVLQNQCLDAQLAFQEIMELITSVEQIVGHKKKEEYKDLRASLTAYHNLQQKIRNDLLAMGLPNLKKKEKFCDIAQIPVGSIISRQERCSWWSIEDLMTLNFDDYSKILNEQTKSKDKFEKAFAVADLVALEKGKKFLAAELAKKPEYKKYQDYYKKLPDLEKQTEKLALEVSRQFQKLYDRMYRASEKRSEPNPCRDFVL